MQDVLVGLADNVLISALQILPLRQWIGGVPIPLAGVGIVTVSPTHRQKGIAAALMTHALRVALERGDVASALYPFRFSFYQKLGYGAAGIALQYLVPPDALPAAEERERVERMDSQHARAEALALYGSWMRGQNGQIERNPRLWDKYTSAQDVGLFGYRSSHGALEGYALVTYRADLPAPERFLEVSELVWTSDVARRGLLGWLASLGDQWRRIMIRALPSHQLGEMISEPVLPRGSAPGWRLWAPSATHLTGPMFRLLDLPRAWHERRVNGSSPLSIGLHVVDGQIEENSGDWHLRLGDGRAELMRSGGTDMTLRLDISTLSRLYISALKPSVAYRAGLLECDRPEHLHALDDALALPEPWMFDAF